ncbi:MAG: hypothetical protein OQL19_19370 [Gammaproteobacteria bacterium]|nr:hypothetical protein [Gammaproteobacteria bacterium]
MKKINSSAVFAALFFTPLISLQAVQAEMLYPVEIKHQPTQVKISNVDVKKENQVIVAKGIISRRNYNSYVQPGHIDIQIMDENDEVFLQETIKVSGLNLRHNRYGRQFRIAFLNELPKGSFFKLNWHQSVSAH